MNLSSKKVFVFDFDGTLVDSNKIKKDAFFLLSEDTHFNSVLKEMYKQMPEVSRYVLLRKTLEKLNDIDIDQKVESLANKYGNIVEEKTINCPKMKGAEELLTLLNKNNIAVYLSSNTPEISLEKIVTKRGWDSFFKKKFGSPREKVDTIKDIYISEKLTSPKEIVVLGDGNSDKQSAEIINCDFIDVNTTTLEEVLKDMTYVSR